MEVTSFQRMLHIVGHLSALQQRLQAWALVSREEMAQAARELEELQTLAEVPGAAMMHQKYDALLHGHLQAYGLRSATGAVPAWDQGAAWRQVLTSFQQTARKSEVVEFVGRLQQSARQLEAGEQIGEEALDPLLSRLGEMEAAVRQLAAEHPDLLGLFERACHRLWAKLGERDVGVGNKLLERGEVEGALPLYRRAYDRFLKAGDLQGQGLALLALAHAHHQQDLHAQAEEYYQQAWDCFRQINDWARECMAAYAWGNLCRERSQFARARELYRQGLQLAQTQTDGNWEAQGHRLLGQAWTEEGRFEQAVTCYHTALQIAQRAGNVEEQLNTWNALDSLHSSIGNREEAIRCYEEALALTDEKTDPEGRIALLINLTLVHGALGRHDAARRCWEEAERLARGAHPSFAEVVRLARPEEE